ncbi:MAG: hypothetical protein ACHQUB_01785 [Candidatus Saccharimonadia bacterium]
MSEPTTKHQVISDIRIKNPALVSSKKKNQIFIALKQNYKFLILGVIGITLVIGALYYAKYRHPANSGLGKLELVEAKVARHYLLPTNEVPALATITDVNKLNTPFFKEAKNGDEILIYEKNQLAIIYRPGIDRIVAVGPVSFASTQPAIPGL